MDLSLNAHNEVIRTRTRDIQRDRMEAAWPTPPPRLIVAIARIVRRAAERVERGADRPADVIAGLRYTHDGGRTWHNS